PLLVLTISSSLFSFNDTTPTETYTLSLHDALPICDLAAARSALVLEIGAAPANPPPATRCHAPPQSLRNIRSAASENTAPALAKDRKSTRLNSSHQIISYAVFCLKKKTTKNQQHSI